jgi:hypothetical protein
MLPSSPAFYFLNVFCKGFPLAPSAFAVASALTPWRSHLGPSDGEGAKGRTPSVEPERRARSHRPVYLVTDRPSRKPLGV